MVALLAVVAAGAAFAFSARGSSPAPVPSAGSVPATSPPSAVATVSSPTTPTVGATVSVPATITVMGVGDMIFDRRVGTLIDRDGGKAPLSAVASLLASADVTVGNLESPLSDIGEPVRGKDPTFRGDPRAMAGLKAAGFDLLSLANNHIRDYGPEALLDTVARLDRAGIAHAGAGEDRASAWRPAVIERGGVKVAYLAYSSVVPTAFAAATDRPGLAATRIDRSAVRRAIRTASKKADVVIVSFHWGVEYKDDANAEQIADAHAAVDAGADLVLSHHPHVIQALERYKRGLIAYSLGDFVFDHYSRKTGEAFVLSAEVGPHGVGAVTVVPVYLDTWGSPEVVKGQAARSILSRLKAVSARRGTTLGIAGSRATVAP
jgi:poly-gamma-glutamate capsule biosynthesis protein CapA/YwtB (metallophosphatase superfamily)